MKNNNFKVGDWVVFNSAFERLLKFKEKTGPDVSVFKITKIDSSGNCYGESSGEFAGINYIDLWRPKIGELCVFFNTEDGVKIVSTFENEECGKFVESKEYKTYNFCAPLKSLFQN